MAVIETWYNQDLNSPVRVNVLNGNVFSTDNYGNVVGIKTYRNGTAASLSGSVSATVVRPDGATVAIVGTLSGNQASVALPYAACAVPGLITICIKNTSGSTVTTLGLIVATVYKTSTDTALDPGTIIPSVEALISQIEEAVDSIPADYSGLWASLAPAYSTEATYEIGDYCTRSGHLYRCVTAINTAESWTAGHWVQVDYGSETQDVQTQLNFKVNRAYGGATTGSYLTLTAGSTWNANSGTIQGNAPKRARTDQMVYTPDMDSLTLKNDYTAYVWGNNVGIRGELQHGQRVERIGQSPELRLQIPVYRGAPDGRRGHHRGQPRGRADAEPQLGDDPVPDQIRLCRALRHPGDQQQLFHRLARPQRRDGLRGL